MNIIDFIKSNSSYFQDFISRSTYHSNAIEGNTLSYAETYAILWNDNSFKVSAEPREWYEATNHKYALSYVIESAAAKEDLTEALIQKVGIMINKNIKEIDGIDSVKVKSFSAICDNKMTCCCSCRFSTQKAASASTSVQKDSCAFW